MVILDSDRESISIFILDECKKLRLDLNESARARLNGIALTTFINQGLRIMREVIAWEISFLAPEMLSRGTDRTVEIGTGEIRKEREIRAYLSGIGCPFFKQGKRYYTVLPKSYDSASVRKRINAIKAS